jgi:hypothetical protein
MTIRGLSRCGLKLYFNGPARKRRKIKLDVNRL